MRTVALLLVLASATVPARMDGQEPTHADTFVATTPADLGVLQRLGVPAGIRAELIEWSLHLARSADGRPSKYTLNYAYGNTVPNQPGIAADRREGARTGEWTLTNIPRRRTRIDLAGTVSFVVIGRTVLHLLDPTGALMRGNGGWSYSLSLAADAEAQLDPRLAASQPEMNYTLLPVATGPAVFGVFEGRTPCGGIAKHLALAVPSGCAKLKWRITLFQDPATRAPSSYRIEGGLFRGAAREGRWTSAPPPRALAESVLLRLDADSAPPLTLLLAGENHLFIMLDDARMLTGNADFNYTLDRRQLAIPATGHIRGRVFDEYGASIPDAPVSFEPLDPRSELASFQAVADSRGRFDFVRVRPGTYRVTAKALGYETTVMTQEVVGGVETDMTVVVRRRS